MTIVADQFAGFLAAAAVKRIHGVVATTCSGGDPYRSPVVIHSAATTRFSCFDYLRKT
jgi:hypothetical protein